MSSPFSTKRAGGNAMIGAFLALVAGCTYGAGGAISQIVRAHGYTVMQVCFAQYACAAAILALLVIAKYRPTMSPKEMAQMTALGAVSALSTYFYYLAIDLISVSAGVAMQFQYVWIVVAFQSVFERKIPNHWTVLAALLIIVGSVFGSGMADELLAGGLQMSIAGIVCALICALFYAAFIYFSGKIAPQSDPVSKSFFGVAGGFAIMLVLMPLNGGYQFDVVALAPWGVLMGVIMSVVPTLSIVAANKMTSGSIVAILTSSELPVAVASGAVLLGEAVTPLIAFGVALILIAIGFSQCEGGEPGKEKGDYERQRLELPE